MPILINDNTARVQYTATAGQTVFIVPYEFFEVGDLKVYNGDTLLAYNVSPSSASQYSVTGAGVTGGGSITLGAPGAAVNSVITIVRDIPIKRLTDFPNAGPFNIQALNAELDKLTAVQQNLETDLDNRVFRLGDSDTPNTLSVIPNKAARQNKLLGFDVQGQPVAYDSASLATLVAFATAYADTFTGNGSNTTFTLSADPAVIANLDVSINGATKVPFTDYTLSGTTLTTTTAVPNGQVMLVKFKEGLPNYSGDAQDIRYTAGFSGAAQQTVKTKLQQYVSIKDFGAAVDGTTDDTVDIQAAITATGQTQSPISFAGGKAYATNSLQNTYGTPIVNGKLVQPDVITGAYKVQTNSYAPDANGIMVGRENLAAWMLANTTNPVTPNNVYIFGDSTVEQNLLYVPKAHGLFEYALWEAGINWVATVNRGVSGTSWSDLNAIPDLGAFTKLIVIKYGINDAVKANNLQTFAADARAKLTAIRAATNGDFYNLSILLMGPSSTYRPATGQDATWYESLRNIYVQLAKEFNCAYFDTYAYLQNTSRGPGFWLDQISPDQGGIHPTPDASWWIWYEGIKRFVIGEGTWSRNKSNHFWNRNGSAPSYTAFPTTEPQLYPMGLSVDRALASNGWPADGTLLTLRGGSAGDGGEVRQELTTIETVPRRFMRTGVLLVWTQWTELNTAPTLLNSWANKGGGYNDVGYMVHDDGFVELYGTITGGTLGTAAFTLPANARPGFAHLFVTAGDTSGGTAATITVFADGNVTCSAASNTTVSLDGVRFRFGV